MFLRSRIHNTLIAMPAMLLAFIGVFAIHHFAFAADSCTSASALYSCVCTSGSDLTNSNTYHTAQECNDHCYSLYHTGSYQLSCSELLSTKEVHVVSPISQGNTMAPSSNLTDSVKETQADFVTPNLNVAIPGFSGFTTPKKDGAFVVVNFLAEYINAIYGWVLGAGALVAVVMMMLGGLQYVLSRGKSKYIEKAKTRITNAITGLVLLLAAYNVAFLIDPATTNLKAINVTNVNEIESDLTAQGGEEESDAITPNDLPINIKPITGDHISYVGTAQDKYTDEAVLTALQAAAATFYNTTGKSITVTDGYRTIQGQATKFYDNCLKKGGYCSPITCYPGDSTVVTKNKKTGQYSLVGTHTAETNASTIIAAIIATAKPSNCPHTSAVAIDAWGGPRAKSFSNDVVLQQQLITAMISAGFCRLSLEAWHFELNDKRVSTKSCTKGWNTAAYERKDTHKTEVPTPECAVWNFKNYRCEDPKKK